jgi:hypothetical protein
MPILKSEFWNARKRVILWKSPFRIDTFTPELHAIPWELL